VDLSSLGKIVLILGLVLAVAGALILLLGRLGLPLGRLPGDIRLQNENVSCYIPVGTMILLSALLTIVVNIVIRLLQR
jgi:hypothetical protein